MASFKKDLLYFVSRIEKVIIENDDLAKKFIDNTSEMSKDVEAVKQLINKMSDRPNPDDHNIQIPVNESLEKRVCGNACSQVAKSRTNGQTVVDNNQIVEGLSRRVLNDNVKAPLVVGGIESVEKRVRGNACSRVENSRENGQTIVNDNLVEGPSRRGPNDNVEVSLVVNGQDANDDVMSYEAEGSVASVSIWQCLNEVDTGDLSGKSEKDLKEMTKYALETTEKSAKKLESIIERLRKVRQQSDPLELTESFETTVLKLKENMSVHSNIVEKMSSKTDELRKELRSRKIAANKSIGTSVTNPAISAKVSSSAYDPLKRKLNESVVDCGSFKRISKREEESIVLKKLKKEENPCDDTFKCNFCERSFVSAGPLAAHLERHYDGPKHQRLNCPWPDCSFANARHNLTKHMRSKHTKEELFQCTQCLKKFRTMDMKMIHEKKHRQQDEWGQCSTCRRFFKVSRGGCSFCQK